MRWLVDPVGGLGFLKVLDSIGSIRFRLFNLVDVFTLYYFKVKHSKHTIEKIMQRLGSKPSKSDINYLFLIR